MSDDPQDATPADDDSVASAPVSDAPVSDAPDPLVPSDAARLAREALERARASARQRGAKRTSPRRGRIEREKARRDSSPYGNGRDPAPMSDAVAALLRRMGWTEQIEVSSVTGRWREVIGDRIADHCEPLGFDEGILTVKATSTAWATQLQMMSGQIRHRINEEFGREIVKELKVLGPTARSWTRGPRTVKGRGPRDTYG